MQELSERISEALVKEEARAEQFASNVRFILLVILTAVAVINAWSVSFHASTLNFAALIIGYMYGFVVQLRIRHKGYHPQMKYITSSLDIVLVFLVLFLYTRLDIPSVALKHYVFLIVFPLIALTAFRYDQTLTVFAGGLTISLYLILVGYLTFSREITLTNGGYERELFSSDVTYIGQLTKILIFAGCTLLLAYLAQYSRKLFAKLVSDELNVRNQKEMTDWELNIASQVQAQFLPRSFPEIAGLEISGAVHQGKIVGGDYYDFIKLADDTLFLVTADVSGSGVPAALIMAEVRASTHLLATRDLDLEDFAQRLNVLLLQSTDKKSFVTFFAAKINTSSRLLTYVNAGHPPPLVCFEGNVQTLAKGTIPLGLYASLPRLTKHEEAFLPGSVLVAYTDGLTEQTNQHDEQFGEGRIQEYIRKKVHSDARSLTQGLLEEVKKFGENKSLNDDAGLAVVIYSADPSVPSSEKISE